MQSLHDSSTGFIVAIPARYASTRLPGKPLRLLQGKPLIVHVAQRARDSGAAQVVVATDDSRVADALHDNDVTICMTRADHASGSDRLAECARQLGWKDDAIVVNLQSDEPFAPPSGIREAARTLAEGDAPMATLAAPIEGTAELFDPNVVKVVCDDRGRALYFSRAPLPWARDAFAHGREALPPEMPFLRHIGIYAYRAGFLKQFSKLEPTPLERAESLEQLRALEHGYSIAVRLAPEPFPAGIDTETDLAAAQSALARSNRPAPR
ncbi:MAG TPA: 3-deoxy-manno-octulosonate cytidylyltransferase [Rhodanobacteraceae bacterium]